jgi:hypothetical protein
MEQTLYQSPHANRSSLIGVAVGARRISSFVISSMPTAAEEWNARNARSSMTVFLPTSILSKKGGPYDRAVVQNSKALLRQPLRLTNKAYGQAGYGVN